MAGSAGAVRAGRAFVEIFADDAKLQRTLKRAGGSLKSFGQSVAMIGAGVSAAAAAVYGPMLLVTKQFIEYGDEIQKAAARTGIGIEAMSELRFAAEQSGASLAAIETAVARMSRTLFDATRGLSTATDAFDALGLSAEQMMKLTPEQQFMTIASALAQVENATTRAAVAQMIFGRGAKELLPLLAGGEKGIEALRQKARDLGITMSSDDANAAVDLKDAWHALTSAWQAAKNMIGAALAPMLEDLADKLAGYVKMARDWLDNNRVLVATVFKLALAVGGIGAIITMLGGTLAVAGMALSGMAAGLGVIAAIAAKVAAVVGVLLSPLGLAGAALVAFAGYAIYASGAGGKAVDWLAERFDWLKGVVGTTMQGIMDAIAAGDLGLAFEVAWAGVMMVFTTATQKIKDAWAGVKWWVLSVWDEATHNIAAGWIKMTAILESVWLSAMNRIDSVWTGTQASLAEGFAWVIAKVQGLDPEQVMALAREDIEGQGAKRQKGRTDRLVEIEREREGALAANEAMREEAAARRQKEYAEQIQGAQQDLDEATRRWEEAVGRAKTAREAVDEGAAAPTLEEKLSDLGAGMATAGATAGAARGTFSAAAAMAMGRGAGADPMLQKADKQIDLLIRIEDAVNRGVVVMD